MPVINMESSKFCIVRMNHQHITRFILLNLCDIRREKNILLEINRCDILQLV